MNFIKKLLDSEYKELCRFEKLAEEIEKLEPEMQALKDEDFKDKTLEFKAMLEDGKTLEDIVVPAFALAREAAYRAIGEKPFHVQILGGLAIHYGNIAEMKTGEGKTLTTILPAYLNALEKKGVHVVTTNEYLSSRNAEWMRPIYDLLGVSVGINLRELSPKEKQEAYNADITYSTNNEVGFDYLRDNMVVRKEDRVQRGLNFCIIDEVDSILIDEARTPLIISGGQFNTNSLYIEADRVAKRLKEDDDYTIDLKTKSVSLTAEGSKKVEKLLNVANLYDLDNTNLVHHINQALKANYGFKKDIDYVVDNDAIIIVDPFTGRLMHGRQYSEGLHQAIEAKEGVTINTETKTMATITFQNLFRMYNKLSGMTGTAKTEEEEFRNIYNMYVIRIPTNKPVARIDLPDLVYSGENGKYKAIINVVKEIHAKHEPILIGTISVEANERLSKLLTKNGLKHEVLNAKNHEREAEIIAHAGEKDAITLATNMAGRGTDIKLGEGVREIGVLYVIGTERHESRRIDNQLRGRAGRQGDVGESKFYIALDDDLMKIFGGDMITKVYNTLGADENMPIQSKMISNAVESAQKKVESRNFTIRKNVLKYDDVMNAQREIIYKQRREVLDGKDIHNSIVNMIEFVAENIPSMYIEGESNELNAESLNNEIINLFGVDMLDFIKEHKAKPEEISSKLKDLAFEKYKQKEEEISSEQMRELERVVMLKVVDEKWMNHIDSMDELKNGIGLRAYGQKDPVVQYRLEGFDMFDEMINNIKLDVTKILMNIRAAGDTKRQETVKITGAALEAIHSVDGGSKIGTDIDKTVRNEGPKIGRNDSCPCGSGKKYKNCCGKNQ